MIPLMALIKFRTYRRRGFGLWIPLFVFWLLLLPLVLLLLPLVFIVLVAVGVDPFRAVRTGWQLLTGLNGTHVEIEDGNALLLIRII